MRVLRVVAEISSGRLSANGSGTFGGGQSWSTDDHPECWPRNKRLPPNGSSKNVPDIKTWVCSVLPSRASAGFSSTAAVLSVMVESSNWSGRYLTLRICRQCMQAVKYSELWQIRGRGAWISDPLQIGFSSSEQILFDSENYSQGIYYGKVKSVGGQSSCKSRALFGCDFNWNGFEIFPIFNSPLTLPSAEELTAMFEMFEMHCDSSLFTNILASPPSLPAACLLQNRIFMFKTFRWNLPALPEP